MRTVHNYRIVEESEESQANAGRYHPALVLRVHKQRFILSAGGADKVDVLQEGNDYYVVTRNERLGYAGLEIFSSVKSENTGSVFFQSGEEAEYMLSHTAINAAKYAAIFIEG